MKKLIHTALFVFAIQAGFAQFDCNPPTDIITNVDYNDVELTWTSPILVNMVVLSEEPRHNIDSSLDASLTIRKIQNRNRTRDYLDVQFTYPTMDNSGESGIAVSESFIYTSMWNKDYFIRYNLDGTFVDTLRIPGVERLKNMVYCEKDGYIYGSYINTPNNSSMLLKLDFETLTILDTIVLPDFGRALTYNPDIDAFYTNNWSSPIMVIDRLSGNLINTIPLSGVYGNFYGLAYDNWSDGGPFVWGFSQDNNKCELVQLNLPDFVETGFTMDMNQLLGGLEEGVAGGLFTTKSIVTGEATLGGLIQNQIIFGLELGDIPIPPDPVLAGYNIYRNDILLNTEIVTDSVYQDLDLESGNYIYNVTAIYNDEFGVVHCESDPVISEMVTIDDQLLLLGGNVFVESIKLEDGVAYSYSTSSDGVEFVSSADINDLGYYFFFDLIPNSYYVYAKPNPESTQTQSFIPTYYGDVYHWEDSQIIQLESNMYNQDINLIKMVTATIGMGSIKGSVYFESKDFDKNPAEDVLMLLLNNSDKCIATYTTNGNGYFEFHQLGNGTYKILCEVIGKSMSPRIFTINNENPSYNNINFTIKSDEIVIGIDDDLPENVSFISDIYPVPSTITANININVQQNKEVTISCFDITGRIISSSPQLLKIGVVTISIDVSVMSSGIKLLSIEFEDGTIITRKFFVN